MAPHRRRESVINKTTTHDGERSIIQDENSRSDNLKDKFIGAIDQGTTSTRFIVFDGTGLPVASYQSEFRQIHAHSGCVNSKTWLEMAYTNMLQTDGTNKILENSFRQSRSV